METHRRLRGGSQNFDGWGTLEGVYTLDRGVTRTLIEKGIDAALIPHDASNRDSVVVARIIQDHYDALDGLFDFVGGQRKLSTGYIKELHAALLRNQDVYAVVDQFGKVFEKPLEKGLYKTLPNNPTRLDGTVHECCPPEHVAAEMDRLVAMHAEHEVGGVPVEVEAAWLHHRFSQIHPFADGNGRVARAIASLVLIKAGWFPLIVQREGRSGYIDALEKADDGHLQPVVSLIVEAQRSALIQATDVAYEMRPPVSIEEAIAAVRHRLAQRGKLRLGELQAAKRTAGQLASFTRERFVQVARQLNDEIGSSANASAGAYELADPREATLIEALKHMQGAEPDEFNIFVRLNFGKNPADELVIPFVAVGPKFRGLIGAVPVLFVTGRRPSIVGNYPFMVNYVEREVDAQARFSAWLERIIVAGLNQWRLTL